MLSLEIASKVVDFRSYFGLSTTDLYGNPWLVPIHFHSATELLCVICNFLDFLFTLITKNRMCLHKIQSSIFLKVGVQNLT